MESTSREIPAYFLMEMRCRSMGSLSSNFRSSKSSMNASNSGFFSTALLTLYNGPYKDYGIPPHILPWVELVFLGKLLGVLEHQEYEGVYILVDLKVVVQGHGFRLPYKTDDAEDCIHYVTSQNITAPCPKCPCPKLAFNLFSPFI